MIKGNFIFDKVVHFYDMSEENLRDDEIYPFQKNGAPREITP